MFDDLPTTYPLTGVRAATTAPQEALLELARAILHADERFLAAWLVGSFATGEADPWSDLDLHCCVKDAAADDLRGDGWKMVLQRITSTIMATTWGTTTIREFLGHLPRRRASAWRGAPCWSFGVRHPAVVGCETLDRRSLPGSEAASREDLCASTPRPWTHALWRIALLGR